ncbi:hypothetical protein SESBI_49276 [Sesbania bispinosa]|nr:hypothetical protein SESBI_49276 [Sesbania bispinosa]
MNNATTTQIRNTLTSLMLQYWGKIQKPCLNENGCVGSWTKIDGRCRAPNEDFSKNDEKTLNPNRCDENTGATIGVGVIVKDLYLFRKKSSRRGVTHQNPNNCYLPMSNRNKTLGLLGRKGRSIS